MGCGNTKASKPNIHALRLAPVGVMSIDKFNDQVERVLDRFAEIQDDIVRKKERLGWVTGFNWWEVTLKHCIVGIILQDFAAANGDLSKVKWDVIEKAPFVKIALNGVSIADADKQIDAFNEYTEALQEAVTEKMPKVLESMQELANKADTLQASAAGEFDALGDFQKMQAVAKTVKLVADLPRIPAFMQTQINDMKKELDDIKATKETI